MLSNRRVLIAGVFVLLIFANIISYIYWNWGLITVKVTDAPLGKVIKSIEWQGWVTIYTNLPLDTKVTMYVDHVPLAEAMETLAANASAPPPDRPPDGAPGTPPPNAPPPGAATAGGPPPGNPPDSQGNGGASRGPGGGGRGGFGGGGGGSQWNLAFFVAPTSAAVKDEIRAFQNGTVDDDARIYNFPTPLQMVASDEELPASDPRLQSWPGYTPPLIPPDPAPATTNAPPAADGQPAPAPVSVADLSPTAHTYLKAFAQAANIWVMAPGSWDPSASTVPPPNSSIISAVKNFVSRMNGSVTTAIILRSGRGGPRGPGGRGGGGGFGDMAATADRLRNAINGLPEDARPAALAQLDDEVKFFHDVSLAPPEQRQNMIRDHFRNKMANNNNNWRRSPEKRAQMYSRMVSNRQTAQGKK